jgi:hypothetical protein
MKLQEALEEIKNECAKHETCYACPFYVLDSVYGNCYCSITREGDVPAEWDTASMIR